MKYYIKLICGFRKDQEYSISMQEAHKAYYLFDHRDQFGTFDNGLAIKGSSIDRIVPDYHRTMGWNPTHQLDGDDHNEMRKLGVEQKMHFLMAEAKEIGARGLPEQLNQPLNQLIGKIPEATKEFKGPQSMKQLMEKRV